MPIRDLNALRKIDPLAYHQHMLINAGGDLRIRKDALSNARNSVERDRTRDKVDEVRATIGYHRQEIENLKGLNS